MVTITARSRFCFILAAAITFVGSGIADAQRASSQRRTEPGDAFVLRTYEVGDLVVNVPDYVSVPGTSSTIRGVGGGGGFGGGGGGYGGGGRGGGGFFSVPDDATTGAVDVPRDLRESSIVLTQFGGGVGAAAQRRQEPASAPLQITFDSLIDAMTSVCAPGTWQENGGGNGDVRVVGAALVVYQTAAVHEQISELLSELRKGSARRRTVSIDARWLFLNSDELDQLLTSEAEGRRTISRERLQEFTRRPTSLRAMTNCFSGQGVYLISGTRRNVVSGYIPVVGAVELPKPDIQLTSLTSEAPIVFLQEQSSVYEGFSRKSVGYQPMVERPNFGVQLQIRPTVMFQDEAAVVDLTATITFAGPGVGQRARGLLGGPDGRSPAPPTIDRAPVNAQELATTLRVPLGEPVLVGGMSYIAESVDIATSPASAGEPAAPGAAVGAPQETPQLYLVLEVR